jgi:hypothetical protein
MTSKVPAQVRTIAYEGQDCSKSCCHMSRYNIEGDNTARCNLYAINLNSYRGTWGRCKDCIKDYDKSEEEFKTELFKLHNVSENTKSRLLYEKILTFAFTRPKIIKVFAEFVELIK